MCVFVDQCGEIVVMSNLIKVSIILAILAVGLVQGAFRRRIEKEKCPKVNLLKAFDFQKVSFILFNFHVGG